MPGFELAEEVSAFTLACPAAGDREVAAIRARGNLPLMIGGRVLAELDSFDLADNWNAAAKLSALEAVRLSDEAGRRLARILEDSADASDLPDIVTDAAVLFLLTLRRYGVASPAAIPPCTLVWEGASGQEHFLMRASGDNDDAA